MNTASSSHGHVNVERDLNMAALWRCHTCSENAFPPSCKSPYLHTHSAYRLGVGGGGCHFSFLTVSLANQCGRLLADTTALT